MSIKKIKPSLWIVYFGNSNVKNAPTQRVAAIKECLNYNFLIRIFDTSQLEKEIKYLSRIRRWASRYFLFFQHLYLNFKNKPPKFIILYNQDPFILIFLKIFEKQSNFVLISQISEKHQWSDYNYSVKALHFFLEKIYFLFIKIIPCKLIVISHYLKNKFPYSFVLPGILPKHKIFTLNKSIDGKNVFYLGRGDERDDLNNMLNIFKALKFDIKYKNLIFYIIGLSRNKYEKVLKFKKFFKLSNIKPFCYIRSKLLDQVIANCKIFLLIRKNISSVHASFPTRAAEMLMRNKIIITTPHLTLNKYAKVSRRIIIVPSNNISKIVSALKNNLNIKKINTKHDNHVLKKFRPDSYQRTLTKFIISKKSRS